MTRIRRLCQVTRACQAVVYKRPESDMENYLEKEMTDTESLSKRIQEMNNVSKKFVK